MSRKWYGCLNNRVDENKMFCEKIEVGTKLTQYYWSDRHCYEVVEVKNQNNVFIRELDAIAIGVPMSNDWELRSNENNPIIELKKRYGYWNRVGKVTMESMMRAPFIDKKIYDEVMKNGEATYYERVNVSFGVADYYYDYEF